MTLFVVQARGEDVHALARASFVPDAFSRAAFVFGPFWLLYRGLWSAVAIWVALELACVLIVLPHVGAGTSLMLDGLAHLFLGLEGNRLREQKLSCGAAVVDLVEATTRDGAEAIFYARHGEGAA